MFFRRRPRRRRVLSDENYLSFLSSVSGLICLYKSKLGISIVGVMKIENGRLVVEAVSDTGIDKTWWVDGVRDALCGIVDEQFSLLKSKYSRGTDIHFCCRVSVKGKEDGHPVVYRFGDDVSWVRLTVYCRGTLS